MAINFRRALTHNFGGSYAIIVIQFATSLVVARLLAPSDFGLYSVAMVFAAISEILRNFGVNTFIIKEKELTLEKLESALTIIVATSLIIGLLQFSVAGLIGEFYESEILANVIQILAIKILMSPFGAITAATLTRDLRFKELNFAGMGSQFAAAVTTISFAAMGYGVYSLAYGLITAQLVFVIIVRRYTPEVYPRQLGFNQMKPIMKFTGFVTLASLISHLGSSSQNWILAKGLGMSSVGIWARGTSTVDLYDRLVSNPVRGLVTPQFAEKSRMGEDVSATYIKLISIQTSIGWPSLMVIGLFSKPIIETLYGNQWTEVSDILIWLCAGKAMSMLTQFSSQMLIAVDRAKTLFYATAFVNFIKVVVIFSTLHFGLKTVVVSVVVTSSLLSNILFLYIYKTTFNLSILPYLTQISKSAAVCLLCFPILLLYDHSEFNFFTLTLPAVLAFTWIPLVYLLKMDVFREIEKAWNAVWREQPKSY